jgi:hypothetical protein
MFADHAPAAFIAQANAFDDGTQARLDEEFRILAAQVEATESLMNLVWQAAGGEPTDNLTVAQIIGAVSALHGQAAATRLNEHTAKRDAGRANVMRCPYCGNHVHEGDIERPADICHHDIVEVAVLTHPALLGEELEGVIEDLRKGQGFDATCLATIQRVRDALFGLPEQEPVGQFQRGTNAWGAEQWIQMFGKNADEPEVFDLYTAPMIRVKK